jgi:hypothetical protein
LEHIQEIGFLKIDAYSTQCDSNQESSFIQKSGPVPMASASDLWVYQRIREIIPDEKSLLTFSVYFGFDPSSLRKVLKNKQVSRYLVKRFLVALAKDIDLNTAFLNCQRVRKILFIFSLYQEKRSLDKVGKQLGLSRERIRQLLNKGTKLGLFDYQKLKRKPLPNIPKEKIIEDYHNLLRLSEVAKLNDIPIDELRKLLQFHQIGKKTLNSIQIKKQKEKCVEQYFKMVDKYGHHPSTAELQKTYEGHYLSDKIVRFWRSIHIFRQEFGICFTPHYGIPSGGKRHKTSIGTSKIHALSS